ncbi:uncharacterized protein F5Z01DRAFT_715536, partial [Emericellopsis atlantica]
AYPSPSGKQPEPLPREQVLAKLKGGNELLGSDFLLVDLRSNDHDGGTICGSINLPVQSLYPAIPTLYTLTEQSGHRPTRIVVAVGSSQGRGHQAAGCSRNVLAHQGDNETQSADLRGGIKGWARAGRKYTEWIDAYDTNKRVKQRVTEE